MKYILFLTLLVFTSCKTDKFEEKELLSTPEPIEFAALKIYDFNALEPLLNKTDGKTYVINFWATWCAPCVKELPYFEQLNTNYKSKNVEVILVSLDFPKHYEKKLKPFIAKHNIKARVVALDDTDSNTWIPKVSEAWSGAIPATLIYNKERRRFFEKSFNYEELVIELEGVLN